MRTLTLAVLGCIAGAVIAANAQNTDRLTSDAVYQKNCAKCHGKSAEGRFMAGPSLVSEKVTAMSAAELHDIIAKGKHRMPKFEGKLQPSEIDALVDEIRSRSKQ